MAIPPLEHAQYILQFIDTYHKYDRAPAAVRELECLKTRLPYVLGPIRKGDLFAGRYIRLAVGFAPQEALGLDYFFDKVIYDGVYAQVDEETQARHGLGDGKRTAPNNRRKVKCHKGTHIRCL